MAPLASLAGAALAVLCCAAATADLAVVAPGGPRDSEEREPSLRDIAAALYALNAKFDAGFAQVDAKFAQFNARFDAGFAQVDAKFAQFNARFDALDANIAEILSATVTPRSAAVVDACARGAARFLSFTTDKGGSSGICSAFAYQRLPGGGPVVFLTAMHCLAGLPQGGRVRLVGVGAAAPLSCSVAVGIPSEDVAVLDCPGAGLAEGFAPSSHPRLLGQAVAVVGFAADAYSNASDYHLPGLLVALNIDFARTVGVAGPSRDSAGVKCSSDADAGFTNARPAGFVNYRVTPGMSGGAVVDFSCRVLGVSHGRSCSAGAYVSLASVDDFLVRSASLATQP